MQVCTSLQTDNHAITPPLCFLQAGCPSCHPTNSVKALKALVKKLITDKFIIKSDVQSTAVFEFQTGLSKILNTPDQMESFCKGDVW